MCMNGTYTLLNHRLLLIEDKQMLCIANKELDIHMSVSLLVGTLFLKICFIIMLICIFIFARNPGWYYSICAILYVICLYLYAVRIVKYWL